MIKEVEVIREVRSATEFWPVCSLVLSCKKTASPCVWFDQVPVETSREVPVYIDREVITEVRVEVPVDVVREVRRSLLPDATARDEHALAR